MEIQSVFALPKGFEVADITIIEKMLTIFLISTQLHPCCPLCASQASHIHSRYRRHVADLPCAGQEVRFVLLVRKFFCKRSTCARLIFAERLTPFIEPWARVTTRLFQSVQSIGLATGGMLGARLADRLGMETSWMTILRRIMALPDVPVEQVIELGIDDFAFRRGHKYGTILVDMVSHKVIDLLPDRTSATSAAWMARHPEIELVSRDRGGEYASVRIVAKIRRIQKICFAAPYAQQRATPRQFRKVYFAAMSKTEGMSRRDVARYSTLSELERSPIMAEFGIRDGPVFQWFRLTCSMSTIRKIRFASVNRNVSFAAALDPIFHSHERLACEDIGLIHLADSFQQWLATSPHVAAELLNVGRLVL